MKSGCATVLALNKWDLVRADFDLEDARARAHKKLRLRPPLLTLLGADRPRARAGAAAGDRARRPRGRAHPDARAQPLRLERRRRAPASGAPRQAAAPLLRGPGRTPPAADRDPGQRPQLIQRDWAYYLENRLRERYGLEGVPLVIDYVPRTGRDRSAVTAAPGIRVGREATRVQAARLKSRDAADAEPEAEPKPWTPLAADPARRPPPASEPESTEPEADEQPTKKKQQGHDRAVVPRLDPGAAVGYWPREKAAGRGRGLVAARRGRRRVSGGGRSKRGRIADRGGGRGLVCSTRCSSSSPVPGVPCGFSAAKECAPGDDTVALVPADSLLYAHAHPRR